MPPPATIRSQTLRPRSRRGRLAPRSISRRSRRAATGTRTGSSGSPRSRRSRTRGRPASTGTAEPQRARLQPLVDDGGGNEFGFPTFVYFVYLLKLVVYVVGAFFVISLTPGLGSISDIGAWWSEPIVFEKLAAWTLLWEIL